MNNAMIIQAWKNPEYRASLPHEQRAALPENPSGRPLTELEDSELDDITGGNAGKLRHTDPVFCCQKSLQCPSFTLPCSEPTI
jgi:mersacidin/lichenicidin family type 2 lantibiotic